jgi:hypothetical protein
MVLALSIVVYPCIGVQINCFGVFDKLPGSSNDISYMHFLGTIPEIEIYVLKSLHNVRVSYAQPMVEYLGHAKEIFCFSDSAGLFLADLKKNKLTFLTL